MTTKRATYTIHGQKGAASRAAESGSVRYDPTDVGGRDTAIKALTRRIERETRLSCHTVRLDSWTQDGASTCYEITLTRPVPRRLGGGNSVEGSLWATVHVG